jgi:hypothetical protein
MKITCSTAWRCVFVAVVMATANSCASLDVRDAGSHQPVLDPVSAAPDPIERPSPNRQGPRGYLYFVNLIRAPFLPLIALGAALAPAGGQMVSSN